MPRSLCLLDVCSNYTGGILKPGVSLLGEGLPKGLDGGGIQCLSGGSVSTPFPHQPINVPDPDINHYGGVSPLVSLCFQ